MSFAVAKISLLFSPNMSRIYKFALPDTMGAYLNSSTIDNKCGNRCIATSLQ